MTPCSVVGVASTCQTLRLHCVEDREVLITAVKIQIMVSYSTDVERSLGTLHVHSGFLVILHSQEVNQGSPTVITAALGPFYTNVFVTPQIVIRLTGTVGTMGVCFQYAIRYNSRLRVTATCGAPQT